MVVKIIATAFMVLWAASFILFMYNFVVMLGGVKQEKKRLINFLGPLAFAFPQLYDDIGNRARVKAIIYIFLNIISIAGGSFTLSYVSH
jgi:hypothetical protein